MFSFGGWLTQTQELTEPSSSTAAPAPDEPKVTSNVDKRPKNLATNLVMRQVKRLAKDDATAAVPTSATGAPPATDNSESTSLFGWFGKFSVAEELSLPPPPPPPPRDGKLSHKAPKAFYQVEPPKMKPQIEEEQPLSRPSTAPVESKVLVQQDEIVFKSPARGALSPSQMRPSLYNGRPMTANADYGMTKSHSNEGHHPPFPQMLSTMRSSEGTAVARGTGYFNLGWVRSREDNDSADVCRVLSIAPSNTPFMEPNLLITRSNVFM